jgi:hypothetical protein
LIPATPSRLLLFFGVIVVALVAVGVWCDHAESPYQVILREVARNQVDDPELLKIAKAYTTDTAFAGKVLLHRPTEGSCQTDMHLVVLKSLAGTSLDYMRPCSSIGECNTIICDYSDLKRFRNSLSTPHDPENKNADLFRSIESRFGDFLLNWLIGHEIGHVVGGDTRKPVRVGFGAAGPCFAVDRQAENAADKFVVRRVLDQEDAFWAWMALNNFIVLEFGKHVDPKKKLDMTSPTGLITLETDIDIHSRRTSHPPLLLRGLDMALTLRRDHPYLENTDYYERVRQRIHLQEEAGCFQEQ